jgi:hypothetical protein
VATSRARRLPRGSRRAVWDMTSPWRLMSERRL